jgi:cytochrome c biogenesis protein CcdA
MTALSSLLADTGVETAVWQKLVMKFGGVLIVAVGALIVKAFPQRSRLIAVVMLIVGFSLVNLPELGLFRRLPEELEFTLFLGGILLAVFGLLVLVFDANRRKRQSQAARSPHE